MNAATATSLEPRRPWRFGVCVSLSCIAVGIAAAQLATTGKGTPLYGILALGVVVVVWKQTYLSPIVLLGAALTIEQFPAADGPKGGTFTDKIPLFHGLSAGLHVNGADLVFAALLFIGLSKRGTGALNPLRRSPVGGAMVALLLAVVWGLAIGRLHGGSLRTSLTEIRPYVYLVAAYAVTVVFATRRTIQAVLWAIVLGTGFKAIQVLLLFISVRSEKPRPEAILGHEEALFFSLFILLAIGLWLFSIQGRLRVTATSLLPIVVLADLANHRRAAWLILGAALIIMIVIGLVRLPDRRPFLLRLTALIVIGSAVYFPAYWNHTGALAQPARAVHSAVSPSTRDSLSDLYRIQENANLKVNIREGGFLGRGFGVPIDYPLPIANISTIDPMIEFVPHDGVLYILMRMGLLGGIAFWSLIGMAIIAACRLSRSREPQVALLSTLVACAVVAYTLEGYNDQGFFFYRIAIVMGVLLGLGEALHHLQSSSAVAAPPSVSARPTLRTPALQAARRVQPAPKVVPRRAQPRLVASTAGSASWLAAAAGLLVAVVMTSILVVEGPRRTITRVVTVTPAATPRPAPPAPPAHPTLIARLKLTGKGSGTWVEVRRGSAKGRVVFSGRIVDGQTVALHGPRLWARFGGAANVDVLVNGHHRLLFGTTELTVPGRSISARASR